MSSRRLVCFSVAAFVLIAVNHSISAERTFVVQQAVEAPGSQHPPFAFAPRASGPNNITAPSGPLDSLLAWNQTTIETEVEADTPVARFDFSFTNVSPEAITVTGVSTSCGCTTAHLPDLPKKIGPAESLDFEVDMHIAGKHGRVEKVVTLATDKGNKQLHVISIIKPEMSGMSADARKENLEMAIADRQAVFRDDCARCHVAPTQNKTGKELFAAACGICHESDHRASMVPDLHNLPVETSSAFWSTWITYGKPNSLMPAFAKSQGGILTDDQITSLVDYLVEAIPPKPVQASLQHH